MAVRALARVNLAAIERNVAHLRARAGSAAMCAVVKGDAYGHGAVPVARAALAAGARWLAVATAGEAAELRAGGVVAPVLVLGAVSTEELPVALAARAELVAWSEPFVAAALQRAAPDAPVRFHVKLDSGMGRLGTRDVQEALRVAGRVRAGGPRAVLAGAMTHFATADEDPDFMRLQLGTFSTFARAVREVQDDLVVHAANSAATLREPASHLDMVRCGIAIYGCDPMNEDPGRHGLEPALELRSYLAAVKRARPGESSGYGRRFVADRETWIGTVPIGYADGVRRALSNNAELLVRGERFPLVGNVSMDNVTVDLGSSPRAAIGDPVTIIGADGDQRQSAEALAARIGTISYEVVCGISARVPRVYHRDGEPA